MGSDDIQHVCILYVHFWPDIWPFMIEINKAHKCYGRAIARKEQQQDDCSQRAEAGRRQGGGRVIARREQQQGDCSQGAAAGEQRQSDCSQRAEAGRRQGGGRAIARREQQQGDCSQSAKIKAWRPMNAEFTENQTLITTTLLLAIITR
ncbi:predicted protein [Histoplasma mississippiense (nom. inval.)]|uniref:predicted protein n=1 Tax=Ajellomyces capsulatus (strain NAm1 / WU24) TaxID=2059318 RepID=UPI000157C6BA|nr:predicted protein [Histoplasma mississippiense (nom. inval.)]EDN08375.1 predicted protein [Histoplasma mississippiense (nom. inval.)]